MPFQIGDPYTALHVFEMRPSTRSPEGINLDMALHIGTIGLGLLGLLSPALGLGAYSGYLRVTDNFAVVEPGRIYRSAQPDAAAIRSFAERQGRGSVINLRGPAPTRKWYKNEVAASEANGLTHFDFKMSAEKTISPDEARRLVALIERAPKPALIHCNAGADRSGLASALYLYAKGDVGGAAEQLSLRYGHFPYLWSRTRAMDESFEAYKQSQHRGWPAFT